jgi:hypothetical protein
MELARGLDVWVEGFEELKKMKTYGKLESSQTLVESSWKALQHLNACRDLAESLSGNHSFSHES